MNIKVAIFEDNKSLRTGLYQLINGSNGFECVGAYPDCSDIVQHINSIKPDVLLMDIGMPGISGIEAVQIVKNKFPEIKILMQTIFEDTEKIFQSVCAGASGYILKNTSPARILEAIRETVEGGAPMSPSIASKVLKIVQDSSSPIPINSFHLSEREKEILACLVKGMSYKLIADNCFISLDTVRGHIRSIYEKLHVNSKSEAVVKAIKGKIV
ncbi:MAG: response regulator transcription factor [Saprospiraceae bacterium]|uniref:Response regulator transcription factor n=1 Tax=Candidatus Opimibacter skivensis TaxID=2982028 RepID=A0A9D7XN66_9BACT|nr:response regulator transcription factor [Candidatus Opimibacter skivensis]